MIFTVGKIEIYEPYIRDDPNPGKAIGGSVWKTRSEAEQYLAQHSSSEYRVYEVDADWEQDTAEEVGESFRALKRVARLSTVENK